MMNKDWRAQTIWMGSYQRLKHMTGNTSTHVICLSHSGIYVACVADCEILLLGVFALEGPD